MQPHRLPAGGTQRWLLASLRRGTIAFMAAVVAAQEALGGIDFLEPFTSFHQLLSTAPLFGGARLESEELPRISRRSHHHPFAVLVLAGYSYDDACRRLGINPRTAERWRTDLRRCAGDYFGRPITYEYAARVALDSELRRLCESLASRQKSVRGSPQSPSQTPCFGQSDTG